MSRSIYRQKSHTYHHLKDLDKEALINILTKPKNALIKQYEKMFDMENVKLTFTDG